MMKNDDLEQPIDSNLRVMDHLKHSMQPADDASGDVSVSATGDSSSGCHHWFDNNGNRQKQQQQRCSGTRALALFAILVVVVGCAASASFLYVGITAANDDQQGQFDRKATEVVQKLTSAWEDYEVAGNWIHESCHNRDATRKHFRELYEYLRSDGLEFQAAEFILNVTHDQRPIIERASREFYEAEYPAVVDYHGFKGFEPDAEAENGLSIQNRSDQPFYFPVVFVEPVEPNAAAAGLDLYSSASRRATIELALGTWKPALTDRLHLVQETDPSAYSVLLMHPGVNLQETDPNSKPRDLSLMVIRVPDLLERAARNQVESLGMYVYDKGLDPPQFLGAISVRHTASAVNTTSTAQDTSTTTSTRVVEFLPEMELEELMKKTKDMYSPIQLRRQDIQASSHIWEVVVVPVDDTYEPELFIVIFTGVVITVAAVGLALCLYINMRHVTEMNQIILRAEADNAIVSNLFPSKIRERLERDAAMARATATTTTKPNVSGKSNNNETAASTSVSIFGTSPIAELYPEITIMFADLVGFTAWSSSREPQHVFALLETLYHGFDTIAQRRSVFKVETIGDCYVACAGLPNPRKDHALVMAKFAVDCLRRMPKITQELEASLGPDTNELSMRIGLHSGPVTAGVLRGDKGRFQLFGDAMNTASRMESTGKSNKIQVSEATAQLLRDGGKGEWLEAEATKVFAKGKGHVLAYFLDMTTMAEIRTKGIAHVNQTSVTEDSASSASTAALGQDLKTKTLVEWNVQTLERLLRQIVVRRIASGGKRGKFSHQADSSSTKKLTKTGMVLDEVKDIIVMPQFDAKVVLKAEEIDPQSVQLNDDVLPQLKDYVMTVALLYKSNPFHNFEHASHVTMSVTKLLSRIVNPKLTEIKNINDKRRIENETDALNMLNDHTFGITSDPVTQFACAFSAVVHDLDHQGIPNTTLVKEESPLAIKYNNKSVAEQNSLDMAWEILMEDRYDALRACIFETEDDLLHFRAVLVNSVMATDIMDKELGALRRGRWEKAFADETNKSSGSASASIVKDKTNRKATIVIEHLIQASDVSHTMQHWHIYRRWNERLFFEMYDAYKKGRLEKDPSESWYQGEIGFFDFYIIPLAKKLETCGVFGVSSYEYKNYALENRREWEEKGQSLVASYLEKYHATRAEPADQAPVRPMKETYVDQLWC